MLFLIYAYGIVSGRPSDQQILSDIMNSSNLNTFVLVAIVLLLCKLFIIMYSSVSCKNYAAFLYQISFVKFVTLHGKTETDWDAFFSIHLNLVTNSVYRSLLSLCSAITYFMVFFIYIASTISFDLLQLLILLVTGVLCTMVPLFYAFRKVAPTIVKRWNIQVNFINTLKNSGLYYFSGFKALYKITEKYSGLVDKLKLIQAIQQFFTELPRFIFELILIIYILFIVTTNKGSVNNTGEVMLLVVRLLPVFSNIFSNFANIYSNMAALKLVSKVLSVSSSQNDAKLREISDISIKGLKLKHNENIFTYPGYNFTFNSSIYRISGVSGSGKSSLLGALVGRRDIIDGNILVNGYDNQLHTFYKSSIFISSEFDIPDIISIRDLILKNSTGRSTRIENYYNVMFPELSKKNISVSEFLNFKGEYVSHKFSAGQKQRLAHFLALFSGSRVLICDEGFCHMDDRLRQKIISLYVEEKIYDGIILVAHDAAFLEGFFVEEIPIAI